MKIKLLTAFILILSTLKINAQYYLTQYFDGADTSAQGSIIIKMDTAAGNIWQVGKPQKNIFHSASTVPNALITDTIHYYPPKNTSVFTFTFTCMAPYAVNALQWMQKIDMDPHHHDGGIVEFSTDSGTTWQNAFNNPNVINFYGFQPANADTAYDGRYAFSGRDTNWVNVWLCLRPNTFTNYNQKGMYRFTLLTDSINNNREGWMIDNMYQQTSVFHPVNEMKKAENLKVYPTLTNGIIYVEIVNPKDVIPMQKIELLSVDGKVIESFKNNAAKYQIDISRYEAGMYFLKITSDIRTENHPVQLIKN